MALVGLLWTAGVQAQDDQCIACHTDAERLQEILAAADLDQPLKSWRAGPLEPQPRWRQVYITDAYFDDPNHGGMYCDECHGGDYEDPNYETAHQDVIADPSYPAPGICADCHQETDFYESSLHYNNRGIIMALQKRANPEPEARTMLNEAMDQQCLQCHASCGQCHVNRPDAAGGGLAAGHAFMRRPSMTENCLGCHWESVGVEYLGNNRNLKGDVHWQTLQMKCDDCHTYDEMHGDGEEYDDMRQAAMAIGPDCLDCHEEIFTDQGENKETHNLHKDRVSCQACHATQYPNCASCHIYPDNYKLSQPGRVTMGVKIGRNPHITEDRPEKFVAVRQVPVSRDMFAAYGPNLLSRVDQVPTWKPATPHSIQRKTPQNADCNACHGNWDVYLMLRDVSPADRLANRPVIVPPKVIPAPIVEETEGE